MAGLPGNRASTAVSGISDSIKGKEGFIFNKNMPVSHGHNEFCLRSPPFVYIFSSHLIVKTQSKAGLSYSRRIFLFDTTLAITSEIVLITGDSGTGKELVASAIHQASNRSDYPFIAPF